MNITELARILKITPQELRNKLPQVGFDIGRKAIKVDKKIAQKIIKEWPSLSRQLKAREAEKEEAVKEEMMKDARKEIKMTGFVTVKDFAGLVNLPVSKILAELMKNGVFASMNEKIDFDTAWLIGSNLGIEVKRSEESEKAKEEKEENKLKKALKEEKEENLSARPPVIVVMGHVDHGKTRLLDAIRSTDVVAGEAGGITQHIGAYQVKRNNKLITFIDTPGHEAFTAMRGRGAKVADIAILVVAADDGVKPQTIEAYNIIKSAKIPFIVAINKIDKDEADINKTKQELSSQLGIVPEDWGGKIICAPISAKAGTGIEELLDMVLLTADMEATQMKANPKTCALGTVIESHIDKGEGPVATILIQNGTLKIGDQLTFNNQIYGKVRALKNYKGETIKEAGPSAPVKIIGLKIAPQVGDILQVGDGEKVKIKKVKVGKTAPVSVKEESVAKDDDNIKKLNLIIKSDVLGSVEAIEESLEKINTEDVKANLVHKGLGNITEGDVAKGEAVGARIIGFNVGAPAAVTELARDKGVAIKTYTIIYDLIDDIKKQMEELIEEETKRINLGKLKVAAIFRTENKSQIVGGKIISGIAQAGSLIEVLRAREIITRGKMTKLQSGKEEVDKVEKDQECGIQYEGKPIIEEGDILQFYKEEKITKSLS